MLPTRGGVGGHLQLHARTRSPAEAEKTCRQETDQVSYRMKLSRRRSKRRGDKPQAVQSTFHHNGRVGCNIGRVEESGEAEATLSESTSEDLMLT